MDPLLVLFGFGVGILVGTTGMGGGSPMTPLLILLSLGFTGALILARALVLTGRGVREEIALDARHKAFAVVLGLSVGTCWA